MTEPPATASRRKSSARVRANPDTDPDWRPVGADGKTRVRFARDVFSQDDLDRFVSALSDGGELDIAARSVGSTATQMRWFMGREPAFAETVTTAMQEGHLAYRDRLRATARAKATRLDGPDRILEVELATHVPGYEHLRRDRVRHEGNVDVSFRFPVEAISDLTKEEALAVKRALAKMRGDVVDGDARELGPGE